MRALLTVVVFSFVLAASAAGNTFSDGTTVLNSSYNPNSTCNVGGCVFTSTGSQESIYFQQWTNSSTDYPQPYSDLWFGNGRYTDVSNQTTGDIAVSVNGDPNGDFGTETSLFSSSTVENITVLQDTMYPVEGIDLISGESYKMVTNLVAASLYNYDCRDLQAAGLGGSCGYTASGTNTTTQLGLGGTWYTEQFNPATGFFSNYQSGPIDGWYNVSSYSWADSAPSQPSVFSTPTTADSTSQSSATPEPASYVLFGSGLMLLSLATFRRKRR